MEEVDDQKHQIEADHKRAKEELQQILSQSVDRKLFYERQLETLKTEVELLKMKKQILYKEIADEEKNVRLVDAEKNKLIG